MMIITSELKRGMAVLATVGSTSPFVGLLGTTVGVINSFLGMAANSSGSIAAVSAGISEALATTALGLVVAIPAVWSFNYFTNKIENLVVEMTYTSKELIDYLIRGVAGEFGRSRFTREFDVTGGTGQISQ
jgi:biopolymer transport protein ExbB/biopolymer transport protein TolQ